MNEFSRRGLLSGIAASGILGGLSALGLLRQPPAGAATTVGQPLAELQGIEAWLNGPPTTIRELQGRVIALQFWTFACINCQRTLPHMVELHRKFASRGLVIIGVHTPEFAYERDLNNIRAAIRKHNIPYRVPVDNRFATWRAYSNQYWPHLFVADRQGRLRYDRIGEGAYDTTEKTIDTLLGQKQEG